MRIKKSLFLLFVFLWIGYTNAMGQAVQHHEKLSVSEFSEKTAHTDSAIILDVRTPREFGEGHLTGAVNINWNDESFDEHVALLDKSAPVFLYCRSGGRSGSAYERLKEMGFEQVFDMQGGMLAWRAAELPEIHADAYVADGMSMDDYQALLQSNALVLVAFYADWCVPCIKMKPYFERIKEDMGDRLAIIRINMDKNRKISEELGITGPPVLILYENLEQVWNHQGYLDEESIREQLL